MGIPLPEATKYYRGVIMDFFIDKAKSMGGHNLPPLIEIGLKLTFSVKATKLKKSSPSI